MSRFVVSIVLSALGATTGFGAQLNAQIGQTSVSSSQPHAPASEGVASASLKLSLSIIAGRDGSNILRPPSAVPPTVEIRDANNRPVTGAIVTFTAPKDAPTVKFPNGLSSYSVVTNGSGQAAVTDMAPIGVGKFGIQVNVMYLDSFANSTISEANYPTLKAATASGMVNQPNRVELAHEHGISTKAKIGIASAVAVAAGIGIYFGVRGGSSKSSVTPGMPTVGAPQ